MAERLDFVTPGEPFKPSAATWNAFVETARTVREGTKLFGVPAMDPGTDGDEVTTIINNYVTNTGCGCCNCLACVNLCDLTVADVVTECAECPNGATKTYSATVADGAGWIETGDITLTHVDGGCVWETAEFDITIDGVTGTYKWVLTQAGAASTLVLTFVDGYSDVVGVEITYTATTTSGQAWSCVCRSKMELTTDRETIPFDSGLVCEVCMKPQEVATSGTGHCPEGCRCAESIDWDVTLADDATSFFGGGVPAGTYTLDTTPDGCRRIHYHAPGGFFEYQISLSCLTDNWVATLHRNSGGSPTLMATYTLAGPVVCNGTPITLSLSSQDHPSSVVPENLTFTPSSSCNYVNPNGCATPGGGTGACTGYITYEWIEGVWFNVESLDCEPVGCLLTCEFPGPPERDGEFEGERVTLNCICV